MFSQHTRPWLPSPLGQQIGSVRCGVFITRLTRFNKIATQGAPQMAVDKEANSLSRVYSYYSKFNLRCSSSCDHVRLTLLQAPTFSAPSTRVSTSWLMRTTTMTSRTATSAEFGSPSSTNESRRNSWWRSSRPRTCPVARSATPAPVTHSSGTQWQSSGV